MLLTDFHCHSHCSPDGTAPVHAMAAAAIKRGVAILCITDHADTDDYRTGRPIEGDCFPQSDQLLRELREAELDMFTTVFVGARETRLMDGRLVTPRGYEVTV